MEGRHPFFFEEKMRLGTINARFCRLVSYKLYVLMKKYFLSVMICFFGMGVSDLIAQSAIPEPPCIVYRTRKNYDRNVAVILSDDGSRIVSYPHPSDVYSRGEICYPVKLSRKMLLDRRGIGPHVAFLSITYEEYSKLKEVPDMEQLMAWIIDKDPLVKMYRCRFPNADQRIAELKKMLRKGCPDCSVLVDKKKK